MGVCGHSQIRWVVLSEFLTRMGNGHGATWLYDGKMHAGVSVWKFAFCVTILVLLYSKLVWGSMHHYTSTRIACFYMRSISRWKKTCFVFRWNFTRVILGLYLVAVAVTCFTGILTKNCIGPVCAMDEYSSLRHFMHDWQQKTRPGVLPARSSEVVRLL